MHSKSTAHKSMCYVPAWKFQGSRFPAKLSGMKFSPICIKKKLVEDFESLLPGNPEVSPCEKASHCVSGKMVDPTLQDGIVRIDSSLSWVMISSIIPSMISSMRFHLLPQLCHDGVYPREASGGVCPLRQSVVVVVPRDLKTNIFKIQILCCCHHPCCPTGSANTIFHHPNLYRHHHHCYCLLSI